MRRLRSQLSIHLYREYSPSPRQRDKAPIRMRAHDMDKEIFLSQSAPAPDQTDAVSSNRAIPDLARARLISLSFCGQTSPSAIAARVRQCLASSLCACVDLSILRYEVTPHRTNFCHNKFVANIRLLPDVACGINDIAIEFSQVD